MSTLLHWSRATTDDHVRPTNGGSPFPPRSSLREARINALQTLMKAVNS